MKYQDLVNLKLVTSSGRTSTRVKTIIDHNPGIYDNLKQVTAFLPDNASATYRIHAIKNNLNEPYRCKTCGNILKWELTTNGYCSRICNDATIDKATGLTRKQLAAKKMAEKRSTIGIDGLSSFQQAALKVANVLAVSVIDGAPTKRELINHKSAQHRKQTGSYETGMKLRRATMEGRGDWLSRADLIQTLSPYDLYVYFVSKVTEKQPYRLLEDYHLREIHGGNQYHIDHMYSKYYGFKNNIPPYIIGDYCNLQILSKYDNIRKNRNCSITKEELFERYFSQHRE